MFNKKNAPVEPVIFKVRRGTNTMKYNLWTQTMEFEVGDSVVVKAGVVDPDFGIDIGGWQGRVKELDDDDTVFIAWDSVTLRQMGLDLIIRCENENLDWEVMTLSQTEVEKTTSRDSEEDVIWVTNALQVEMSDHPLRNTE